MRRHRRAIILLGTVAVLDIAAGIWYAAVQHIPVTSGLCYALGVVTTSGSSVAAGTAPAARLITALTQLLLIPLAAAVISLATSRITAERVSAHVEASENRIKKHIEDRLKHHLEPGERGERLQRPPGWPPRKDTP